MFGKLNTPFHTTVNLRSNTDPTSVTVNPTPIVVNEENIITTAANQNSQVTTTEIIEKTNDTANQLSEIVTQVTDGSDLTNIVFKIASGIDISWFEWSLKIGIAAIIVLCFKELIFSIYRYISIRMDRYIGIGTVVKFGNDTYGKILDYNLKNMTLVTKDGLVKIPLEVWLQSYYTQVHKYDVDIKDIDKDVVSIKRQRAAIDNSNNAKMEYLYNELCELKKNNLIASTKK